MVADFIDGHRAQGWLGLRVGGHPALSELSQWFCHDDSTVNISLILLGRIAALARCILLLKME